MSDGTITNITGGSDGLAAAYDAVHGLAEAFDLAGSELRDWAGLGVRTMADPDLVASALLSPVTFGLAEAAVVAATTGPDGVLAGSLRWETDALLVRGVVDALQVTDRTVESWLRIAVVPQVRAGWLAGRYGDDGSPRVVRRGAATASAPPADLEGLVRRLSSVADRSPDPDSEQNGTIEVQTIGNRHIVYLPGTDDMTTLPWTQDGDVRDMATNLRLSANLPNSYQQGILDAMRAAGIGPDDPVLLVGHSQGGMEAAAILSQGSEFNVTNVVTAGSPTAQVPAFPEGTHVLSLENEGDVVPLLDLAPNPDTVEQVTVTFDGTAGPGGVVGEHSYAHYVAGAALVDASTDPSVREQLASLRAAGFLGSGGSATSQVFQITRRQ
ncbi:hypothetical protein GCM10027062_03540 [Nocardioides hungaricus]